MRLAAARPIAAALLVAACSGPAVAPQNATPSAEGAYRAAVVPEPQSLRLDGQLDEWPAAASPHVLWVAFSESQLTVAASLVGPAEQVEFALATVVPSLPPIGWSQRGGSTYELTAEGCQYEQVPLAEAHWARGNPNPPEVASACLQVLARQQAFREQFSARFVRRFRLTVRGVEELQGEQVRPLDGARFEASEGAIEVQLPLASLPELAQSPLSVVFLAVGREAESLPPPTQMESPGWSRFALAPPMRFGPSAELLAAVLRASDESPRTRLSYHPSQPERLHAVQLEQLERPWEGSPPAGIPEAIASAVPPDRPRLLQEERALLEPLASFGQVSLGLTAGHEPHLASLMGEELRGFEPFPRPSGVVRRGDELHVLAFEAHCTAELPAEQAVPIWRAIAVRPDGSLRLDVADDGVDPCGVASPWDGPPTPFSAADFESFGLRGTRDRKPQTVIWRWNAGEARYRSSLQATR